MIISHEIPAKAGTPDNMIVEKKCRDHYENGQRNKITFVNPGH